MERPEGGEGKRSGRDQRSSMARAPPGLLGALLLLLLLSSGAASPAPPPPGALGQLRGYLGQVSSALLERLSLPEAQERVRTAYEQGSAAVVTYTGILTDQLYHWWRGEQ